MNGPSDDMIEQWLEGTLESQQIDSLMESLQENPAQMRSLVEASIRDQMLRDLVQGEILKEEIQRATPGSAAAETTASANSFLLMRYASAIGLAACLLIAVVWFVNTNNSSDDPAPFLSVVYVSPGNDDLKIGDRIGNETIEVEEGVVRLLFDDGAEVTLQGPAQYQLASQTQTRLVAGVLTATVPPGSDPFRVDSLTAQNESSGAAFGIDRNAQGTAQVSVFDGEVKVLCKNNRNQILGEGESARLTRSGELNAVAFEPGTFEKLWPAASGIVGSSGAFEFAPQWPRPFNRIQSNTLIYVLPEGYASELSQPCPIDVAVDESLEDTIPTGRRVRSFLLQFNPDESEPATRAASGRRKLRRIEGSITFERPVVGLMIDDATLKATDSIFAIRRGLASPIKRGLELGPPRIADDVSLSEDGRTLTLKLVVFDRLTDHVRVIVDASIETTGN